MGGTDYKAGIEMKHWEAKGSGEINVNSSFNDTAYYCAYKM